MPLDQPAEKKVIGFAMAIARLRTVKGALRGRLINGLITKDAMAELLLWPYMPLWRSSGFDVLILL